MGIIVTTYPCAEIVPTTRVGCSNVGVMAAAWLGTLRFAQPTMMRYRSSVGWAKRSVPNIHLASYRLPSFAAQ